MPHSRYYSDLWELDLSELRWTSVGDLAAGPWPPARSGCQIMLAGDTLFLYGGYVKVRTCFVCCVCAVWFGA